MLPNTSVVTMELGTNGIVGTISTRPLSTRHADVAEPMMETKKDIMANGRAEKTGVGRNCEELVCLGKEH